jgi:hypothetical protein
MTDTNEFDPFKTNEQVNYLEEAKKKFSNNGELDLEGLARGKYESDKHIARLEAEAAELRKQASQGMAVKDLLEAIRSEKNDPPQNTNENREDTSQTAPNQQVDIAKLVQEEIDRVNRVRAEEANKSSVNAKLREVWGENASVELQKVASSLGVSLLTLQDLAKSSPQAFFRMTGIDQKPQAPSGSTVPTSTVNLPGGNSKVRDKKYYDNLKSTNRKLYESKEVQAQEMRDALALGAAFFN